MAPMYLWIVALTFLAAVSLYVYETKTGAIRLKNAGTVTLVFLGGVALAIAPLVAFAGSSLAVNSALTYKEMWNGIETGAVVSKQTCHRDGSCQRTYDCDSYTVTETYTDSNGKTQTRTRTEWHSCPYTKYENTWKITTTLGDVTVGDSWLPENPGSHRWRAFKSIPSRFPSGTPKAWTAAKKRLDAGIPAGVSKEASYKNYFLASNDPVLTRHSAAVDKYDSDGLLPDAFRFNSMLDTEKVAFVGKVPAGTTKNDWVSVTNRLNAAVGSERQGDVHVVVVTDPRVTNPAEYSSALRAHWWSKDQGKHAFAKNGIAVVIGASKSGDVVEWAEVFTGMPEGNRTFEQELKAALPGTQLTPEAALGAPKVTNVGSNDPKFSHSDGVVDKAIFSKPGYVRVCMGCEDKSDTGQGYVYLKSNVKPSGGAVTLTVLVGLALSGALYAGIAYLFNRKAASIRGGYGSYRGSYNNLARKARLRRY